MLDRATQLLRCSLREGGCVTRPFGRCATNGALQSSPSRRCAAGNPRSPALLGAAHSLPSPPARSLASSASVYSIARKAPTLLGPEGGVPTGRMGAGSVGRGSKSACADLDGRSGLGLWPSPQRSAERVCPAACRRVGEKALCSGPFRADAESSQPPSRSEQPSPDANSPVDCSPPGEGPGHWPGAACKASVPSPQARAATAKPRRDTTLGPRATRARADLRNVRNGPRAASHRTASVARSALMPLRCRCAPC
jgi:hypothetical protein